MAKLKCKHLATPSRRAFRGRCRLASSASSLAAILLTTGVALADDDDEPGAEGEDGLVRPVLEEVFLGESAIVQEEAALQTTVAGQWSHTDESDTYAFPLILEYGITERLQLEASLPVIHHSTELTSATGLGRAELGFGYGFVSSSASSFAATAGLEVILPAISDDDVVPGGNAVTGEPFLALYKGLGPIHSNLSLGLELEQSLDDAEAGEEDELEVGVEAVLSLYAPLGMIVPVIEGGFELEEGEVEIVGALGAAIHPGNELEIGLAGTLAAEEGEVGYGAMVMLTKEWEFGEEDDDDDDD